MYQITSYGQSRETLVTIIAVVIIISQLVPMRLLVDLIMPIYFVQIFSNFIVVMDGFLTEEVVHALSYFN